MTRAGAAAAAAVLLVAGAVPASPASAWGLKAHRWVAVNAARLVAARCPALGRGPVGDLAAAAVEPDTVLKDRDGPREAEHHYLDLDHYGPPPFRALPRDWPTAVARFGRAALERQGTLPWNGADVAHQLRDEIRRGDVRAARRLAGHLAHYAADATMPLHTTENHDGQRTGQRGIHRRVEMHLVDDDLADFTRGASVASGPPIVPADTAAALFTALEHAYTRVAPLLDADRNARRGTRVGSPLYYRRLHVALRTMVGEQLGEAVSLTAALWQGACDDARARR